MATYTEGVFTPSVMLDVKRKSSELFTSDRSFRELEKPIQVAAAILGQQDVALEPTLQRGVCVGMSVMFQRSCDIAVIDCETDACKITGPEIATEAISYTPNGCIETSFTVLDEACDNNHFTFADNFARAKAKGFVELEAKIAEKVASFLFSSADTVLQADVDAHMDAAATVEGGNNIAIAENLWESELLADIEYLANQFDMMNTIKVTGKNFHTEKILSQYKSVACCTNSEILNDPNYSLIFDTRNLDSTLSGRYTFVVDPGAIVFWSTKKHKTPTPTNLDGNTGAWYETLPRLTYNNRGTQEPVYVDMLSQRSCTGEGQWGTTVRMKVTYGLHKGPDDCNGKFGILKFKYGIG